MLKSYFIQYKFQLPKNTKHSSYNYQKLFRAIYGYTQNVTKSSGKTYRYRRPGLLSFTPHIHLGKNTIIVPEDSLNKITDFFKSGKNPTHAWRTKGDWKATFVLDESEISEKEASKAIEKILDWSPVETPSGEKESIFEVVIKSAKSNKPVQNSYLVEQAKSIVSSPWFEGSYKTSNKLSNFFSSFNKLNK